MTAPGLFGPDDVSAMVAALMEALAPFPEARVAAARAIREKRLAGEQRAP